MHEMIAKMIVRILAQESPKSELRLQGYGEKNFRDLFVISRKWLGLYLEIFLDFRGVVRKFVDYGMILHKYRGLFVIVVKIFGLGCIFQRKIAMDSVHHS
jgi:hypothetical protein